MTETPDELAAAVEALKAKAAYDHGELPVQFPAGRLAYNHASGAWWLRPSETLHIGATETVILDFGTFLLSWTWSTPDTLKAGKVYELPGEPVVRATQRARLVDV